MTAKVSINLYLFTAAYGNSIACPGSLNVNLNHRNPRTIDYSRHISLEKSISTSVLFFLLDTFLELMQL